MPQLVRYIHIRARNMAASTGVVQCGHISFPCALGKTGRKVRKCEGDGATAVGIYGLRKLYYRADRLHHPRTSLPKQIIRSHMGWCDAGGDRNYNRLVKLPYPASHEKLARDDGRYDLIIETTHNFRPRIQGMGSALFCHIASEHFGPTAGCISLSKSHLLKLLQFCSPTTRFVIWSSAGLNLPRPENR